MGPIVQRTIKFIVIALIATSIYFAGYLTGHKDLQLADGGRIKLSHQSLGQPKSIDFGLFWEAWNLVDKKFVGKTDTQKQVYGAIEGMLGSLNDPYTVFMPPSENNLFEEDLSGTFEGIGVEIAMKNGEVVIVSPLEGSPGEAAGLKPGDIIIAVNDKDTMEMNLSEIIQIIRGKAGTEVTLTISRQGWAEPKEFKIKRAKITIASVKWEMKSDNVAYIRINQFGDDTSDLMERYAEDIAAKHPKAIVLDLRNNPGGYLDVAKDVASLFLTDETIVKIQYRSGKISEGKRTLSPKLTSPKLIVLVNEGSASASEILAGAIQDYGRGQLIGAKTFGKGSVQDLLALSDGGAVKITTAKWLTAKGRSIDGKGLSPDINVESKEQDQSDKQLQRALEEAKK